MLLYLLMSVTASAQYRPTQKTYLPSGPEAMMLRMNYGRDTIKIIDHHKTNLHWTCVEVNSGVNIMITRDKSQVYLGNSKKSSSNGWLRIGSGLCRTLDGPRTIFYSGGWKNDLRHGEGITYERGGDCTWSKWRYGKIVKDSTREATEAEKAELEREIKDLESFLPYID